MLRILTCTSETGRSTDMVDEVKKCEVRSCGKASSAALRLEHYFTAALISWLQVFLVLPWRSALARERLPTDLRGRFRGILSSR
jgi:hypothetical protein